MGSIPGSGRSSGVGNGNPPQYSFPENFIGSTVHGVAESGMTEATERAQSSQIHRDRKYLQ